MGKSDYSTLIRNNVHVAAFRLQQKSKHDVMIKHFTHVQKLLHHQVVFTAYTMYGWDQYWPLCYLHLILFII